MHSEVYSRKNYTSRAVEKYMPLKINSLTLNELPNLTLFLYIKIHLKHVKMSISETTEAFVLVLSRLLLKNKKS